MAEEAKTRPSRTRFLILAGSALLLLAVIVALGWFVQSEQFADIVRRKAIAALEDATGGRVDLNSFHWNLRKLEFEADGLTIHGLEPAGQLPYVHADRVRVRLHIVSFFETRINLDYLGLDRPVIHVIVYPDGTTNAPEPKVKETNKTAVQRLFDLAITHAELNNGTLVLNDKQLPLDFSADDVAATMTYTALDRHFDGKLQVGKMDVKYQDFRDVAAQGEMEFALWSNRAQIKTLKLTSQKSSLEGSGTITDFDHPQTEFSYKSTLDVGQVGAVTRIYELRGGTLTLNGSGTYSDAAGFASRGAAAVQHADYTQEGLALRDASGVADFALGQNDLTLSRIATRVLGGLITGDVKINNLVSSSAPVPAPAPVKPAGKTEASRQRTQAARRAANQPAVMIGGPGPQQGTARLRISNLLLPEVARVISTPSMPISRLNPAGRVSGTLNLGWKQSLANADVDVAIDVVAPAQVPDNQLPVNATVRGRFHARSAVMEFSAFHLTTRHTQLDASGIMGSSSGSLKVGLETTSLTEFQPLLAALGNSPIPVELAGTASFQGTLSGSFKHPQIAGHVQASDFTYLYTPATPPPAVQAAMLPAKKKSWLHVASALPPSPPPAPVEPVRIHIDQFSGDIQYSSSQLALHHGLLQEGNTHASVDVTTALDKGNFTVNSPFQIHAAMHNADVAALQRAAGFDYPVTGTLNFDMQATGTEADPHGSGHVSLTGGEAYGRPIKSLTSDIVFANHEAKLNNIHALAVHGDVEGSAAYNFASKGFQLDLSGSGLELMEIPELQRPRLETTGVATFTVKGSGTLDQPVLNGHLEIKNLGINSDMLGGLAADATTHGTQLQLTVRSDFPKANFSLTGTVELRGDMPANLGLEFVRLDIDPFLQSEIKGHITRPSQVAGEATLAGPLKQPQLLKGVLKIDSFDVAVDGIPIASDGPIELRLANQVVSVQRCSLSGGDSHFTMSGSASLKGDHALDLHAKGQIDLKLVHTLDPDITSYGGTTIDVAVAGSIAQPLISGRIAIEHAGLSRIDLPAGLGDMNGTLVFDRNRLQVEQLTARMGGGVVTLGGSVTYGQSIGFDLTAVGTEIRFRYAGISVTSDQTLHLTGMLQNAYLNGEVTVTRFAQIPSNDLRFALVQTSAPERVSNPTSPLNNLHLDVRIQSAPELTVQTSLAKLSGDVDLRLRGTAARPVLLGRINVAEGDIKINGTKYHLERGDITFTNPVRIDPVLDVEATTTVRDYDISIGLHGTLERLNTTYRSDPPLSSDDIVALLAFGRTQADTSSAATPSFGFAESASNAMLGQAINQTMSNRVTKLFGVSSIRINPAVGGPDNNPNARLTVEQQVSNNVTLTYITNLTQSAQQVIQFEYNITPEYTVQAIRDENGVVSIDLLVRKRKR